MTGITKNPLTIHPIYTIGNNIDIKSEHFVLKSCIFTLFSIIFDSFISVFDAFYMHIFTHLSRVFSFGITMKA